MAIDDPLKTVQRDTRLIVLLNPGQADSVRRQVQKGIKPGELLRVSRADSPGISILGKTRFQSETKQLIFEPRFPLDPGTGLTIRLSRGTGSRDWSCDFIVPRGSAQNAGRVIKIFPSSDRLPANLLKFYIHFSLPMQRGEIYQYFSIVDLSNRKQVELPFLELPEELWSRDGKRLTLIIDPGRIKRGLKPREEMGAVFEPGRSYEFRISGKWTDQSGRRLGQDVVKKFRVTEEDHQTPDHRKWRLETPVSGTDEPLRIHFDEPLDAALALRVIDVFGPANSPRTKRDSSQKIDLKDRKLEQQEQDLVLYPQKAWKPGAYLLRIGSELEDRCGNQIGKPFDLDLKGKTRVDRRPFFEIRFSIR